MTLRRVLLVGALALASGCADTEPPPTFEYIVTAVLAPSCASASCHNSMTMREDLAFDTVEATRASFDRKGLVPVGGTDEPDNTQLVGVLIVEAGDEFIPRMPIDSPMPDADINLIRRWIIDGAVME